MSRSYNRQSGKQVITAHLQRQVTMKKLGDNSYGRILRLPDGETKLKELAQFMDNDARPQIITVLDWFCDRGLTDEQVAEAVATLKGE